MPSVPTKEATSDLSELIQRAAKNGERVVLRQDGKPIAAYMNISTGSAFRW